MEAVNDNIFSMLAEIIVHGSSKQDFVRLVSNIEALFYNEKNLVAPSPKKMDFRLIPPIPTAS